VPVDGRADPAQADDMTGDQLPPDHGKDSQNKHTDLRPMPCLLISSLVNARKQEVEVCCFNSL
jgi:hypothetical protein